MSYRHRKSKPAFILLSLTGWMLLFIGGSMLVAGCFLAYHDTFKDLRDKIEVEYDYSHYWVGGAYLITSVLTLFSGCRQNRRRLTFTTVVFLIFSMTLSLFAIVLDGPNWVQWKNVERTLNFWEDKDGYSCQRKDNTFCICSQENGMNSKLVSGFIECDKVMPVTAIYGVVIGGSIVGLMLCLASLLVMLNSLSWKNPWKSYTSYTASYVNSGKFSSLDDIMELYKGNRYQTMASSNASSTMTHQPKDYAPAWSLYGSTVDDLSTHGIRY